MNKTLLTAFCCLLVPASTYAGVEPVPLNPKCPMPLIPAPHSCTLTQGSIDVGSGLVLSDNARLLEPLAREQLEAAGLNIAGQASLRMMVTRDASLDAEAYGLSVTSEGIRIAAATHTGCYWAVQTLRQILRYAAPGGKLPCCEITDAPAFGIRGFMEDVGRNFRPVEQLKQEIEVLSRYKLNTFHFHLTDSPGWRIESKAYPQLTLAENMRATRLPGQHYTQDEIRGLVQYAAARHVQIIPEMDMPGHSEYFDKTFGFSMQDPRGMDILKTQIAEWAPLFPCKYFHIGTDEVRIKNKHFVRDIVAAVRAQGKIPVGWRPGARPIDKDIVTQLWRGDTQPRGSNPFIDSRANYLNHLDPIAAHYRLFFQQPCRQPAGDALALGGILGYWPDVAIPDPARSPHIAVVYPALVTYAEAMWRGREQDYPAYWTKLPAVTTPEYAAFVEYEQRLLVHRGHFAEEGLPFQVVRQSHIPWQVLGPIPNGGQLDKRFAVEQDPHAAAYSIGGQDYRWGKPVHGGTIHLNHFFGFPGVLPVSESNTNATAYARTYIHSSKERTVGFWIGFHSPSVSGRREPSAPQSHWTCVNSEIWVNKQRIAPPVWNNPDVPAGDVGKEIPFTNEVYTNRPATEIPLKKGRNTMLLRLPNGTREKDSNNKWCFTVVPVHFDVETGTAMEVKGLVFSTGQKE